MLECDRVSRRSNDQGRAFEFITLITLEKEIVEEAEYSLPEELNIVVLCGGLSTQRNISFKSGYQIKECLKGRIRLLEKLSSRPLKIRLNQLYDKFCSLDAALRAP